jgi:divalent metal cation (Fe/Co/Zn/Cd) transporter
MLAEAFHGRLGNEVLLLVAQRRSGRPADERHPWDTGEKRTWALIASLAVVVAGALLSLWQGIDELVHPQATSFGVAYAVLFVH